MNYSYTCDGMLTIEVLSPVADTLNKTDASELSNLVAKDLNAVLKVTSQSALVVCGAVYASEQLLQPKFPIQDGITQYASAAFQGQLNTDQILSIGANDGFMPQGLQPKQKNHESVQSLLHIPFCLYTHDLALAERFETQLMHKGMVSPPTYQYLTATFNSTINHANYMTYLDLVAMMHNHFEHMGLTHLWQIIETALVNKSPKTAVQSQTNNYFYLVDHLLFTPFFTLAEFQQLFNIKQIETYINWLMAQRLSVAAFEAHGLEVKSFAAKQWPPDEAKICLGEFEKQLIPAAFYIADGEFMPVDNVSTVNYYNHPQAGTVAIAVHQKNQAAKTYYPVTSDGLNDIKHLLKVELGDKLHAITHDLLPENQAIH